MTDEMAMRKAIQIARDGIRLGQSPFGAVIVRGDGHLFADAHNTVLLDKDPTAHAEMNSIRKAAQIVATYDLSGCTIYSTCEPCPMCLAAIHWANIDRVCFGASIVDADEAGFGELAISAQEMVALGRSRLRVESGLLVEECRELFNLWKNKGVATTF